MTPEYPWIGWNLFHWMRPFRDTGSGRTLWWCNEFGWLIMALLPTERPPRCSFSCLWKTIKKSHISKFMQSLFQALLWLLPFTCHIRCQRVSVWPVIWTRARNSGCCSLGPPITNPKIRSCAHQLIGYLTLLMYQFWNQKHCSLTAWSDPYFTKFVQDEAPLWQNQGVIVRWQLDAADIQCLTAGGWILSSSSRKYLWHKTNDEFSATPEWAWTYMWVPN